MKKLDFATRSEVELRRLELPILVGEQNRHDVGPLIRFRRVLRRGFQTRVVKIDFPAIPFSPYLELPKVVLVMRIAFLLESVQRLQVSRTDNCSARGIKATAWVNTIALTF